MKLAVFSVFILFCVCVYADNNGVYEIVDGDCYSAYARDQVFRNHVHKFGIPLISREATSSWVGNQRIYCLKVHNNKDASEGATCKITEGGVGSNNVTIEMHSEANHGLDFDVEVYAI